MVTKRNARRRCRPPTDTPLRQPMKHCCAVRRVPSPESGSSEHRTTTPFVYLRLYLTLLLSLNQILQTNVILVFAFWGLCNNISLFQNYPYLRHGFTVFVHSKCLGLHGSWARPIPNAKSRIGVGTFLLAPYKNLNIYILFFEDMFKIQKLHSKYRCQRERRMS